MANSGKLLLKAYVNTTKGLLNDTFLNILLQKGEKLCMNVRLICYIVHRILLSKFLPKKSLELLSRGHMKLKTQHLYNHRNPNEYHCTKFEFLL